MNKSLGLTMIVRNVEPFIEECLRSISPWCDETIIVDTGSQDRTVEVIDHLLETWTSHYSVLEFSPRTHPDDFLLDDEQLERLHGIPGPFSGKHILANFGRARQLGWESLSTDYGLWIDSDDLVVNPEAIRPLMEKLEEERLDAAMIPYEYSHDEGGNPTMIIRRERLIRRACGARWHQRIHETIHPLNARKNFDDFKVVHRRDHLPTHQILHRNLKVLSLQRAEEEKAGRPDPRTLFYLAQEWGYLDRHKALPILKEYVRFSGWDEERARAYHLMGKTYEKDGDIDAAFLEYSAAAVEFPDRPEGVFGCARCFYYRALNNMQANKDANPDWRKCIEYTERGLAIVERNPPNTLPFEPRERDYEPYRYVSLAYIKTNRIEDGLAAARKALLINPRDELMIQNVKVCEEWLNPPGPPAAPPALPSAPPPSILDDTSLDTLPRPLSQDQVAALAVQLWKISRQEAESTSTLLGFLDCLPSSIANHPAIVEARRRTFMTEANTSS